MPIPQNVALPAQRQIERRKFETVVGRFHGLKARQRSFRLRCRDKVHLTRLLAAPHAPAQLMQLRKAEAVGVFHYHDRGVRHIHAHLYDRGSHEHLRLVRTESLHNLLLLDAAHSAVQKFDRIVGKRGLLKQPRLFRSGRHIVVGKVGIALYAHNRMQPLIGVCPLDRARRRLRVALG